MMTGLRAGALRVLGAVALVIAGCGSGSASKPPLTVSAAASLKSAFTSYSQRFNRASVHLSFGGSDLLAAQIRQGFRPDVFAAANTSLPEQLYKQRLVLRPVVFAANQLVLAVPTSSSKIRSLSDVQKPGVKLAIGSPTVPIGIYTRTVLARLGDPGRARVLANVRSAEPDVTGLVGKLTQGAVDGGFTYITDVRAAGGKLRAIPLARALRPVVSYAIAAVHGSTHLAQARAFIAGLLSRKGRAALLRAGFLSPGTAVRRS
jgi:molybdate transport system substrate-binding protein